MVLVKKQPKPVDAWSLIDAPFFYETDKVAVWLEFFTSMSTQGLEMSGIDGKNLTLLARGPHSSCVILKKQLKDFNYTEREDLIDRVEEFPKNTGNPPTMRKKKSDMLYAYLTPGGVKIKK